MIKRRRVALMVMVDALGARFLRDHRFLPELEYRASLRTVLGFSCACQPTLLSGKMPAEHGHGSMYMLREGSSVLDAARPFHLLPSFLADNHRVRRRIQGRIAERVDGYFSLYDVPTRLLPRFDLVERRNIFRPGGLRSASSIFDTLQASRLAFSTYDWRTPEEENFRSAERDLQEGRVDFVFLYLPFLDGLLHRHGPGGDEVVEHLEWYERRVYRLIEMGSDSAEIFEFYLFSDHGMSPVHGGVDLKSVVEHDLGRNGRRYLAFYDSTMARFWYDDPHIGEELVSLLKGIRGGRLIPEDEREELGIRFADRSQGDLLFVMDEGLLILPSYMGGHLLAGMHGYHPSARHADACLLGLVSPDVGMQHIRDLHHLMSTVVDALEKDRR